MKHAILETKKLCKSFSNGGLQQHILKNIDLTIYKEDFTVLMGASGAGKSTLLYALSGMDQPTLGKVLFEQEEISAYAQDDLALFRRTHCGFVFQQMYLLDSMSLFDNVLAAGLLIQKDKKQVQMKAKQLFERVGIKEAMTKKFPSQLSGGEIQRSALVRALINQPDVLFADEPTGALNSQAGHDVLELMSDFHRQGQSIVMVTHDLKSALRGNRILYIKDGSICGECELGEYTQDDAQRHHKLRLFLEEMGW